MRVVDFVRLSPKVKLYKIGNAFGKPHSNTYTKGQVEQMIVDQIYDDLLTKVSKKEIKERVRNLIDKFEPVPPKQVLIREIKKIMDEMKLKW